MDGAPNGPPIAVTRTPGVHEELNDASGDYIVYTSFIDGVVIFRISDGAYWSLGDPLLIGGPRIDGNWLVWSSGGQVMLYNLNDLGTAVQRGAGHRCVGTGGFTSYRDWHFRPGYDTRHERRLGCVGCCRGWLRTDRSRQYGRSRTVARFGGQ
ncbi:hypothetical protein ES703_94637 [subsurface metagenome]